MNWEVVGSSMAAFVAVVGGFITFWKAYKITIATTATSPTPKPLPTPPTETKHEDEITLIAREVREGHRELRDIIQRNHAVTADDLRDILKMLDRLDNQLRRP
jgi:hypothetical protein